MIVTDLQLRNFRNYESLSIVFDKNLNMITGMNAQGKTNLLESLVYGSLTRSFRTEEDKLLIRNGCDFSKIQVSYLDEDKENRLTIIIHPNGKTLIKNGVVIKKSSDFIGSLNVVLFSPDDMKLFSEAPKARRNLVNREITKISNKYLCALNTYNNLLKQRNSLLKSDSVDLDYLDVFDNQMIEISESIIQSRSSFVTIVNRFMKEKYQLLSQDQDIAQIRYDSCVNREHVKEELIQMYRDSREKDLLYKVTNCGIQREDFIFTLNQVPAINYASQGQKRMMMLALRLSLLEFIKEVTGKKAILLLDDVLSELDMNHQKILIQEIHRQYQCLLTCTEVPTFLKNQSMKLFHINNGMIKGGSNEQ